MYLLGVTTDPPYVTLRTTEWPGLPWGEAGSQGPAPLLSLHQINTCDPLPSLGLINPGFEEGHEPRKRPSLCCPFLRLPVGCPPTLVSNICLPVFPNVSMNLPQRFHCTRQKSFGRECSHPNDSRTGFPLYRSRKQVGEETAPSAGWPGDAVPRGITGSP